MGRTAGDREARDVRQMAADCIQDFLAVEVAQPLLKKRQTTAPISTFTSSFPRSVFIMTLSRPSALAKPVTAISPAPSLET
jgi:hypothetical protein